MKSTLSLGTILFLIFMILKLTHNINWSWWWITCPLWANAAFWSIVFLCMFCGTICLVIAGYDITKKK